MKQPEALPQQKNASKLATTSLLCGIAAWGCLFLSTYLLSLGAGIAMTDPEAGAWLLVFVILGILGIANILILPGVAILKGIQAIRTIGKNGVGKKWLAGVGITLGALLYLFLVGSVITSVFGRLATFSV